MLFRARTRMRIDGRTGRRVAMRPRLEALETRLTPSTATQLVILTPPPAAVVAGQAFGLTIAAEDSSGDIDTTVNLTTVVIGLASDPGGGTLGGSTTATFSDGVASFTNLTLNRTGQGYSLLLASGGLSSVNSPGFDVVAAAPSQLVVTTSPPATVAAGQAFGLTVATEDQYGNVATNFSGNMAVAPSDITTEGSLGGVLTVPVADGSATFSGLSLVKAGTPFTLQVSATGLPSATTSPFTVTAAAPVQLGVVTPPPTTVTAGVGFGLTLAAEDAYGNVDSSASGDVTVAMATDPTGDTMAGATTLPLSGGLATFSGLTLTKAGSGYVLQATSTGLTAPSPGDLTFSVAAGTPSQLALISPPPASVTAGTPFNMVLAAEDQYGNVVTSLATSVSLALADNPGGSILGGATSVAFSAGLASFTQLTLTRVGTGYSFLASSYDMTPTTALADLRLNVVAAGATQLVVTSEPPFAVTTGESFGLTVTAEDTYGNTATGFSNTLAIAPANAGLMGNLGGPLTAQASGGVATFSGLSLEKPGSPFTLQITSTGLPLAVTSPFTVSTGQATQLVVIAAPSSVTVGTAFGLQVAAEDPYGNIDGTFGGTVSLSMATNPNIADLGGTLSATAVDGVATFSGLTLDATGPGESLSATTAGLASATTGLIDVVASGGTDTSGSSSSGGDSSTSSGSSGSTTTGGGSSGGTTTGSSSSGTTTTGGGPSDTTSGGSGTSVTGPYLVISSQPATVTAGHYFQISVVAEDAQGQVDTGFSGKVTVALANNPTGAVLGGTLTMPVIDGVLTFYGLTLNAAGSGYTIRATAGGFNAAVSSPITAVDPPSGVGITGPPPSSVAIHQAFGLTVAVEGASGSVVPDYSGNVTIALVGRRGGARLHGPRTVQATGGVAQFSGLFLTGARKGSAVALRITADGVDNAATEVISIPAAMKPHRPGKGRTRR